MAHQAAAPFAKQLGGYSLVSITQTFVEFGVFALANLLVPAKLANAIAIICSASYNFILNRNVTFKASSSFARSLALFILLWVWNLLFSTAMITLLPAATGIGPLAAKLITMCCQGIWGFLLCRYVIFK